MGKSLGYHNKPIVLVNVANFFGPLLTMLEHGVKEGFIKERVKELIYVASNIADAMEYLKKHQTSRGAMEGRVDGIPSAIE